jgi:glutaredoxin
MNWPLPGASPREPGAHVMHVEVYGKRDCCLCDDVKATLVKLQREIAFDLREIDIESTPEFFDTYKERIPLVFVNGRLAFKYRVDETTLRRRLLRELARA